MSESLPIDHDYGSTANPFDTSLKFAERERTVKERARWPCKSEPVYAGRGNYIGCFVASKDGCRTSNHVERRGQPPHLRLPHRVQPGALCLCTVQRVEVDRLCHWR